MMGMRRDAMTRQLVIGIHCSPQRVDVRIVVLGLSERACLLDPEHEELETVTYPYGEPRKRSEHVIMGAWSLSRVKRNESPHVRPTAEGYLCSDMGYSEKVCAY
jgi:hypothetical protein